MPGLDPGIHNFRAKTWMAGSSLAMTTERRRMTTMERVVPYRTTAAVCPNSSLRSSSVRIAGWPKFGLTSFALA